LLDSTRLAMGSFDLWRDILATNRDEVLLALDGYIEKLTALRGGFETEFRKGSEFARSLRQSTD
jgi:prephenate dehydrogenase